MTVAVAVVAAVAVVLAVSLAVVSGRWQRASRQAAASTAEAEASAASAAEATASAEAAKLAASEATASAEVQSARADDAEAKATDAERRAGAAEARAAALAAAAASPDSAGLASPVINAVWALQQLQVTLARRDLARISTAASETAAPAGLADALGEEVTRIREEIGTPGELQTALAEEPPPAVALLVLRATEALLPILTRRSDAYDVLLAGGSNQVEVAVACEGADPEAFPDADTDAVAAAIAGAGGTLGFDRTEEGRVRALLRCQTAF